jgi:hypothetical protein
MTLHKREYSKGTYLWCYKPWDTYAAGAAICPDGKLRRLKRIAFCADTFSTIPASVEYKGKTVAGFVTFKGERPNEYVEFVPYKFRKNGGLFDDSSQS